MVIAGSVSTSITVAQIAAYFTMPNTNLQVPSAGFRNASFHVEEFGATIKKEQYDRLNGTGKFCPTSIFFGLTVTLYDADAFSNDIA
jgi:hypothetical protein